jgi:hypothetical protein
LVIANSIDPSFGSNPEPLNLVRLVAPKTSRSFVFANSTNYEIFLNKLGVFSQVQAFTTFDDEYLDDDNVIYIYLVPDVTLNISSNEDYFSIPVSNFLLTQQQRLSVLNLIEDSGSMIATTVVKIVEPVITRYVANVVITMFEGFDPETIRQEIRNKISDYMLNLKRRDFIPKSDMIAIIESVEGVDSVSFFFVGQKNEANQILMRSLTNVTPAQMEQQIGLNSFGDIIIGRNELVVLRGGWTDRNGINYEESITAGKPGPLNISISNIVQRGYNSGLNTDLKRQIIASSTV